MDIGNIFKVDHWSKFVLFCGILFSAAAFFFDIQFVNPKYLLGLGIGLILIGIGYWMAKNIAHQWGDGGMYQWPVYIHNWTTRSIIGLGTITALYFLIRVLIQLAT